MKESSVEDELFCLKYELRLLAAQVLDGYQERWIDGFSPPIVSWEHTQRYQFAAGFVPGQRVLDLACGTGRGSRLLAESGAASVLGCDLDPAAVRYGDLRHAHAGLTFRVADALDFHEPEAFDFAVCYETIEHVREPARLLSNLAHSLTPYGRLLVSTPISPLDLDQKPVNAHHIQEWGFAAFQALVAEMFHIDQVYVQYYVWGEKPPNHLKARLVRKWRRFFPLPSPVAPRVFPRPKLLTWQESGLQLDDYGPAWSGYQVLLCSQKEGAGKRGRAPVGVL